MNHNGGPMNHNSTRIITALLAQRTAGITAGQDLVFRVMILEGAAGVPPHKWAKRILAGAHDLHPLTIKTMQDIWPNLDPDWYSPRDQGLAKKAWDAANSVLRNNPHWDADHVISTQLTGSSGKMEREGLKDDDLRKSGFYMIGQYGSTKSALERGKGPDVAMGHAAKWGKAKGMDLARVTINEHSQHGDRVDTGGSFDGEESTSLRQHPSTGDLAFGHSLSDKLKAILFTGKSRYSRQLMDLLEGYWNSRGKQVAPVMLAWFKDDLGKREIAAELGLSEAYVGRVVNKEESETLKFLTSGKAKDIVEDILELAGAGLGYHAPRYAKRKQQNLRGKVIRLAHANPELRGTLLPLLNQSIPRVASGYDTSSASENHTMSLRKKLIRLAHAQPALRASLLPILATPKNAYGSGWEPGDRGAPKTPWGPAQDEYQLAPGVSFVSTAGHGGIKVSGPAARKLSPQALSEGMRTLGGYWYEEDVQWVIPIYENPAWGDAMDRAMGSHGSAAAAKKSVETSSYLSDYRRSISQG